MGGRGGSGYSSRSAGADTLTTAEATSLFNKIKPKLTEDELEALSKYQRGYDGQINDLLRGYTGKDPVILSLIEKLKAAIAKSPGLARDTMLYRGVGHDGLKKLFQGLTGDKRYSFEHGVLKSKLGKLKGQVFSDPGFNSSSFSKDAFGQRWNRSDVILRIKAPAGTKGVPLHKGAARTTGMEHEKEYLLILDIQLAQ
jgi:hypothetical protein